VEEVADEVRNDDDDHDDDWGKKEKERHTFAAWILFPDLIHDRQSVIV